MASLLSKIFNFAANAPVPNLTVLDNEFQQLIDALSGVSTGKKLLVKTSDATDAPIICDQIGAGDLARWRQNGLGLVAIANSGVIVSGIATGNPPISVTSTTVCTNLNADRVDGIEGANIAKLDTNVIVLSKSWYYPVLPGAVETIETQPRFIVPSVGVNTITKIYSTWATGSASGASNIFTIKRRNAAGTLQSDVGTKDLNGAGQNIRDVNDISDVPLTAGDQIYPLFTTRNTASEQGVTIAIEITVKLS